jgi:hypothetical protein
LNHLLPLAHLIVTTTASKMFVPCKVVIIFYIAQFFVTIQ